MIQINKLCDYKKIVSDRGNVLDINRYSWQDFLSILKINIMKANKLVTKAGNKGTYQNYLINLNQSYIFMKQFDLIDQYEYMYVLNWGIFF